MTYLCMMNELEWRIIFADKSDGEKKKKKKVLPISIKWAAVDFHASTICQ